MKIEIETHTIKARKRKLKTGWTFEKGECLIYFGRDILKDFEKKLLLEQQLLPEELFEI